MLASRCLADVLHECAVRLIRQRLGKPTGITHPPPATSGTYQRHRFCPSDRCPV